MATATEALPMSDDLWNALFINKPASCREHRCWVDQCPAGSHDEGEVA
ncbi:hypothetical protein AB0451_03275 [Streptomyces sp. NPDC052000]